METVLGRSDGRTIVYSDYAVFGGSLLKPVSVSLRRIDPEHFRYWLTVDNSLHGCTLLVPKEAFIECGTFDETLRTTQDYDLWFRMAEKFTFIHLPEVLVNARSHPEQGSIKLAPIAMAECNTLLARFVSTLGKEELTSASENVPAIAYALIARNLRRRGFHKAARCAALKALESLVSTNLHHTVAALSVLLRDLLFGRIRHVVRLIARNVLPTRLRDTIRMSLFRWAAPKRVQYSSADSVRDLELKEKFSEVYAKNIFGGSD